jgi:hypothetical protein
MDHIQPTGVASCLVLFLILFPILCTILWRIAYPPLFFFFFSGFKLIIIYPSFTKQKWFKLRIQVINKSLKVLDSTNASW